MLYVAVVECGSVRITESTHVCFSYLKNVTTKCLVNKSIKEHNFLSMVADGYIAGRAKPASALQICELTATKRWLSNTLRIKYIY